MKEVTKASLEMKVIAMEILNQLGGNRFVAMTGAKNFVYSEKKPELTFQIGSGAKNRIKYVKITLNSMDLYDVEFFKIFSNDIKTVATVNGIYNDQLQEVFTRHTGFYTHL